MALALRWARLLAVFALCRRAGSISQQPEAGALPAHALLPGSFGGLQATLDGGRRLRQSTSSDPVQTKVSEKVDEIKKSYRRTSESITKIKNVPAKVYSDFVIVFETFLPHWSFSLTAFLKAYGTVCIGVVWFFAYFMFIYTDDRSESLGRWDSTLCEAPELEQDTSGLHPDTVLVFRHPSLPSKDGSKHVSFKKLDDIVVEAGDLERGGLTRIAGLLQLASNQRQSVREAFRQGLRRLTAAMGSPSEAEAVDEERAAADVTRDGVRKALLQDLYSALPGWGFDVTAFSSVDRDEVFMAVSLQRRESIQYFVARDNISLQLRQEVAEKLGIKQDPDAAASSPAFIMPNQRMMKGLSARGIIACNDETELFRSFQRLDSLEVLSSTECVRVLYRELASYVDLGAAKEAGFLLEIYPVHNPETIRILNLTWANWSNLLDLSFIQPVNLLRQYFGARIAFLFAWNGVYCKALLALVAVASLQQVVVAVCKFVFGFQIFKFKQVIGFSIVLIVWSRIALNIWEREQNFFLELWNMHAIETEGNVRPRFHGESRPSALDGNIHEKQYPRSLKMLRSAVSALITVGFVGLVAGCIFAWMLMFDGRMGVVSSVLLSVQIKVFNFMFTFLARALTDFENHKYQEEQCDSLLWKLFLFEFVNNYSAFFFITIRYAWFPNDCPSTALEHDCMPVVEFQLILVLCILSVCSIAQVLAYSLLVKAKIWHEGWSYRRSHGKELPHRFPVEEQAKYAKIEETEEVQNMTTLAIALGYVLLFGGVSSLVVPLAFCVFCVQLRAFAVLLTRYGQRTFPARTRGIGNWQAVVRVLMSLGVVYSGFLFVAYGQAFKDAALLAKMTGFFMYCAMAFLVWAVIDILFPAVDADTVLLAQRRKYVVHKLMTTVEEADHPKFPAPGDSKVKVPRSGTANLQLDPVLRGAWDEVDTLHGQSPRVKRKSTVPEASLSGIA